ncbi:MAG: cupin domain-containing protein [Verrucomicrobiota bacterium]
MPPKLDIRCIVSGAQTGGAISVFKEIVQPGIGPPRHIHHGQIEIFHVLSGILLFEVDGVRSTVTSGGAAVVPVGAVHAFRNIGDTPATLHYELLPSGNSEEAFERIVREEIEDAAAFFESYGMKMAGPPLEAP